MLRQSPRHRIGDAARLSGVPPANIRYYEKEGLIPGVKRKASGAREFEAKDCEVLLLIDCLKQSGMSIKEISHFIELLHAGERTLEDRADILSDLEVKFKEELKRQKQTLKRLQYENWVYRQAVRLGSIEAVEELPSASMPKKLRKIKKKIDRICRPEETF